MQLKRSLMFSLFLLPSLACTTMEGPFEPTTVSPDVTRNASQLKAVKRFAFGSCNKQYLPQPLWKTIVQDSPDLFLWTGDVVYADTEDMGKLSQIYASQLRQAEYASFLKAEVPVIGVWDDHDYGENNGDKNFGPRKASQALFLDFVGEPQGSPRRIQDGIQTAYSFGEGKSKVRFILLDTRSNRSQDKSDLLGEAQWQWLESELGQSAEGVTFLVSSIQVFPTEQKFEKWSKFPASHKRLLKLIETSPSRTIVIISGDRHFAELSRQTLGTKTVYEVTASGLTHAFRNPDDARNHNSLRVGPILDRLNYGFIELDEKSVRLQVKDLNRTSIIDQTIPIL